MSIFTMEECMKLNYKSHSLLKMYDIILYLMALSFILSSSSMYTVITDYYDAGITDSLFVIIFCVVGFIYWSQKRIRLK